MGKSLLTPPKEGIQVSKLRDANDFWHLNKKNATANIDRRDQRARLEIVKRVLGKNGRSVF